MKLCTFTQGETTRIGIATGNRVVDLRAAAPSLPGEMVAFLAAGEEAMATAQRALSDAEKDGRFSLPLAEVRLEAPVLRPPKFLAIGHNYAKHAAEGGREVPTFPVFFNKQSTCVIGPADAIHLPAVSTSVDYEGELGFVVGKRCRHVGRDRAEAVIAGYLIVNDVSARDWQMRSPTMTLGKSFDTHGPTGPYLVTKDEVGDPHDLELATFVNGERRQHARTSELIFDCFAQVEWLSKVFTLEPGDIVSTGTPAGVGAWMKPPRFLVPGDVVRIEIERIGALENPVIAEPSEEPNERSP